MGVPIGMGAVLQCSFGVAPSPLSVLPTSGVMGTVPLATIMDNAPMLNIMPFGMCQCPANPVVAAATAAALGVLTPMPCIPATAAPWAPGSPTVLVAGVPLLDNQSKLICSYGGVIQVTSPGQVGITSA